MTWKINEDGKIEAVMEAVKDKEFPDLPRFGDLDVLNKKMDEITYFGMGPQESYRDKHQASWHGLFRSKVAQMHEDYIRPGEWKSARLRLCRAYKRSMWNCSSFKESIFV